MKASSAQLGLFDSAPVADESGADESRAALGRATMREMIGRLAALTVPPWKDQMSVILDDGAFKRAMRLVPAEEGLSLWAEYDAHTERLYAVWLEAHLPPEG